MFFFISNRRFARRIVFAFFVMLCLSAALLFAGCSGAGAGAGAKGNLNGTWDDGFGYGLVLINTSAKTVIMKDDYEGTIVNSPDFTAANGVLIIKFTQYITKVYDSSPPYDFTSTPTPENIGKFAALYWTELTVNSVKLADGYEGFDHVMFATQELAEAAFLPAADTVGTYAPWGITAVYTKK
jgi:hypothetical protein